MLFRLYTLGCKVNQYESEFVRTALLQNGYAEAPQNTKASLVIVNTCTVTSESEAKSRKFVRKLINENPHVQVVAMGCAVTHHPDSFLNINGVSQILTDKEQLPQFLTQLGLATLPKGIESFGERHRAFIKIQDGCSVGCSYCIIPQVRPTLRSRQLDEILPEIQTLVQNGYREIVLTGIHLGHYGIDFSDQKTHLTELIRRVADFPQEFRVRLSSLEAVEVSDELLDLMVRYPDRLCPHLHLPMQSGSDAVLQRMKRRWLSEPYANRCEEILSRFDRLALTTDVIVGFPGETESHFDETCKMVERLRFSKVHVFRYSPREGTAAALLPNRVSPEEQKRRAGVLSAIANKQRCDFADSLVGIKETVLLETATAGTCGRYLDVQLEPSANRSSPHPPPHEGMLVNVQIKRSEGDVCFGILPTKLGHTPCLVSTS